MAKNKIPVYSINIDDGKYVFYSDHTYRVTEWKPFDYSEWKLVADDIVNIRHLHGEDKRWLCIGGDNFTSDSDLIFIEAARYAEYLISFDEELQYMLRGDTSE